MGDPLPTLFSESTPALQIRLKISPMLPDGRPGLSMHCTGNLQQQRMFSRSPGFFQGNFRRIYGTGKYSKHFSLFSRIFPLKSPANLWNRKIWKTRFSVFEDFSIEISGESMEQENIVSPFPCFRGFFQGNLRQIYGIGKYSKHFSLLSRIFPMIFTAYLWDIKIYWNFPPFSRIFPIIYWAVGMENVLNIFPPFSKMSYICCTYLHSRDRKY